MLWLKCANKNLSDDKLTESVPFPVPMPGYFFAIIYLAYTFYGIKKQNDGIGHSAHLGGAIGGIFISLFCEPNILISSFNTLAFMILVIFFVIVYYKKK